MFLCSAVSVCSQFLANYDCHRITEFQATARLINSEITCQYLGLGQRRRNGCQILW